MAIGGYIGLKREDRDMTAVDRDTQMETLSPRARSLISPNAPTTPPSPAARESHLIAKDARVPLHLNLPVGLANMAWAMWDGFKKYGYVSWRNPTVKVSALSMIGAAERHLQLLKDGQNYASDSHAHHAGHVMASMQIYLDCEASKKPGFDDRIPGPAPTAWPCKEPEQQLPSR